MKNYKYLLLVSTCLLFNNNSQASELDLTFNSSSLPLGINTTLHTHTPNVGLKPISNFVKLAAVCSVGGGGCQGLSFGSNNNDINLDNEVLCKEQGYMLSGNCADGATKNSLCPYNEAFFKSCICDTARFTQSGGYTGQCGTLADVNTCTSSDGSKYYHCNCDISFVTKCNFSNQYIVSGAEVCRDSQNGDYIANADCKTCNLPAIVNSAKNNCTCPSNYITCATNQNGIGTVCTVDGGNKFTSCECPDSWTECNTANSEVGTGLSCTIDGITKFESCGCPTSYKTCNLVNNEVEIGKSCTIGGITKFENCSCPSNFVTCNKGGEAGAKKCTLNGTDYWSQCKPELTPEQICRQKLATHSSASGYTIFESGKSQSMGKGYIIVGNPTAPTLPGTKIYGAPYFSQIPECVNSMAKLTLNPTLTVVTSTISTITSLHMENVEIELDPVNNTGKTYIYVTGILIDPGTGSAMNNVLKNVIFSSKMRDYSYYYLKLGNPKLYYTSSGSYVKTGANNTALYMYGSVEMRGFGNLMLQPLSGPVYITSGTTFKLDGTQLSGESGGQIRINNGTMIMRYLSISEENTRLANRFTESILIMENNSKVYISEKMHSGGSQSDILSGSELNIKVLSSIGAPISVRDSGSKFNYWNPTSGAKTNVKTTTSYEECGASYSANNGMLLCFNETKISQQLLGWKCCLPGRDLCGAQDISGGVWVEASFGNNCN